MPDPEHLLESPREFRMPSRDMTLIRLIITIIMVMEVLRPQRKFPHEHRLAVHPIRLSRSRRAVLPPVRRRCRVSIVRPAGAQHGLSDPLASLQRPLQPGHQCGAMSTTQPAGLQTSTESPLKPKCPDGGFSSTEDFVAASRDKNP